MSERKMLYAPIRTSEGSHAPERQFPSDAGLDLSITRAVTIQPGARAQLPTNIAVALPPDCWGLVLPRSSTFYVRGLLVHPGVVDPGYRGEVCVLAINFTPKRVVVQEGERLAQLLLIPLVRLDAQIVESLPMGDRGGAGFGSTGGFEGRGKKK